MPSWGNLYISCVLSTSCTLYFLHHHNKTHQIYMILGKWILRRLNIRNSISIRKTFTNVNRADNKGDHSHSIKPWPAFTKRILLAKDTNLHIIKTQAHLSIIITTQYIVLVRKYGDEKRLTKISVDEFTRYGRPSAIQS